MEKQFSIDDSEFELTKFSKVCTLCAHFDMMSVLGAKRTCKAFPTSIPMEIWTGKNNHKKPVEGDKGIQFKLHPDAKGGIKD